MCRVESEARLLRLQRRGYALEVTMRTLLYERWLEVSRAHPNRIAVWDGASGRTHSFQSLVRAADQQHATEGPIQYARGSGVGFILSVIACWRDGTVLVPLEPGQSTPTIDESPPAGIVHLKTTSATSGAARMIAFTAEQLAADCDHVVQSMGLDVSIPNVGAISLAHSYGFSNLVLPLLLKGIPLFLSASALPESVRSAIGQAPTVALPSVPALWQAWHDAGILSERIRIAISAGAPLPLGLEQLVFESAGVKVHNFYGSSECGGIAYDATDVPRTDAGLAGTPLHGVEVEINTAGCVTVRSAAVGSSYLPQGEATLEGGLFQSGDLGEIVDGQVYLKGRASDRINVAGRKVVPEDVERALAEHPEVTDCLVFGVPSDNLRNETIVACVAGTAAVSPRSLTDFLSTRLPSWQLPRHWWLVDSLTANQRGKRSRAEWRSRWLNGA